ncbi:MAG: arsenate reductase ArsC [Deltaproteobacteria bacterium HGW-Deltaproteobacteria-15]|nr:MAG: arsenate reductase ArsC [Deltaproteobacteria bacterium HGW-Deltaproteobacteria-15]
MDRIRVLFVCTHNSARSVMAETFLNSLGSGRFHAESAGLEPRETNPLVVRAMKEEGYDLSGRQGNSIFEYFKEGRLYDYVVYVCASEDEDRCPVFPGVRRSLHWPFPDPSKLQGTEEEKLSQIRRIRDQIRSKVETWIHEITCVFKGGLQ